VASAPERYFDKHSPVDGSLLGSVAEGGAAEVDAAVRAARTALPGPWGRMSLAQRTEMLYAVAREIDRRFDDFLDAEVADTGKPRSIASHVDIPRGAANFRVFADAVKNVPTEFFEMITPEGRKAFNYSVRAPKGVIAVICPWNLPLLLMTLEGCTGARVRQHGGGQALGGNPRNGDTAGRGHANRGRATGSL